MDRENLYRFVWAHAGTTIAEVAARFGVLPWVAQHHLNRLHSLGRVTKTWGLDGWPRYSVPA